MNVEGRLNSVTDLFDELILNEFSKLSVNSYEEFPFSEVEFT